MSPAVNDKKIILVIGATGAQGLAVIDALLRPAVDGTPSPYAIRALTRDPTSKRAKSLTARGVECVKGKFEDYPTVFSALQGAYGAWVNTDGFTVGHQKEIHAGIRIFEMAKQTPSLRHYVWSSLDYVLKKANYASEYQCDHYNAKGIVAEWMQAQPSIVSDTTLSWSVVTTGPYMEMMNLPIFGPANIRTDGTVVFASSIGNGHISMIALRDLGFWARYTFDNRKVISGIDLEVCSEIVGWDNLVDTFKKITGRPAVYKRQTMDEWWQNFKGVDRPIASEREKKDGSVTIRDNFSGFWAMWRNDIIKRDMEWIRRVNPNTYTLERWMKEHNYDGQLKTGVLKITEDAKIFFPDQAVTAKL